MKSENHKICFRKALVLDVQKSGSESMDGTFRFLQPHLGDLGDGTPGDGNNSILFGKSETYGGMLSYYNIARGNNQIRLHHAGDDENASINLEKGTGNVGIGAAPVADVKLAVAGTIKADKFQVADWVIESPQTQPPDYVFDKGYNLKPLTEVEYYVMANKHLPDVPSAKEMKKNGLDLAQMNMTLLKKVEELTLYTIEQNKKIEKQNNRIEKQQKQIDLLMKKLQ